MHPSVPSRPSFERLFEKWAMAALAERGWPSSAMPGHDRIPATVKSKVEELWKLGLIYPERSEAYFCIADRKNGNGSRYKWFSYGKNEIVPNWEYFVQLAGFRDLVMEYGYPAEWMKFEYHESSGSVNVAVDIGIKIPGGGVIFVEVKESEAQWKNLITAVQAVGEEGVDLDEPDRGNDPLRKAKYIIGGHPDYFVGYSSGGFDAYRVIYHEGNKFALVGSTLPRAPEGPVLMMHRLLSFLEDGFHNPAGTIERLRGSIGCSGPACSVNCHDLLSHFSRTASWSDTLFFEWCRQWYASERYEEPLNAFFTLPLIGMYLSSTGLSHDEIVKAFHMEFKGGGRLADRVPTCLMKGSRAVSIGKRLNNRYMCADFLFLPPLPTVVAEVKIVMPGTNPKTALGLFMEDLMKCEEWLKPDASPFVRQSFGIDRFEHALAILIDLGCQGMDNLWRSGVDEAAYRERGIIVKRIVAGSESPQRRPKKIVPALRGASTPSRRRKSLPIVRNRPESAPASSRPAITGASSTTASLPSLETAIKAGVECQLSGSQVGVDVFLPTWQDAQNFVCELKDFIRVFNRRSAVPIKTAAPWVWRTTSTGRPMTKNGEKFGVELRFSFQKAGNGLT